MKAAISGLGWVTPLGAELDAVFTALRDGAVAETKPVRNAETGRELPARPVPARHVEHLARNPRLRRSSNISYFAVAAAQAALADAGASADAIVFAVSDGGVIYTRRFYDQIVRQGANTASPLLFPETVYNAPASHLAAVLGIDGATYTLVGDNSVGLAALHFGAQLLALGGCERVLVVGCEELDWIVCEAFHDWRLDCEPLAEGAGAVLLTREGPQTITTTAGVPFLRRADAAVALREAIAGPQVDLTIESLAPQLGEAPGASALWQVIVAALALRRGEAHTALVPVPGFNQQAAAVRLSAAT